MPFVAQSPSVFRGILSEADSGRSRSTFFLSRGKSLAIGQVAKVERVVSLTTTADTHSSTTLDALASSAGLIVGDVYDITGTGIPARSTFTYAGAGAGVLSQAATAAASGVSVAITRPFGVGPWLASGDTPAGVSLHDVDATAGVKGALFIARGAEVDLEQLVYPTGMMADVVVGLASIGVICRV